MTLFGSLVRSMAPQRASATPVAARPAAAAPARLDVTLTHRGQTRRYVVRPGRTSGSWTCELVVNGRHRSAINGSDADSADNFTAHAERSIAYLEEEGWVRAVADKR